MFATGDDVTVPFTLKGKRPAFCSLAFPLGFEFPIKQAAECRSSKSPADTHADMSPVPKVDSQAENGDVGADGSGGRQLFCCRAGPGPGATGSRAQGAGSPKMATKCDRDVVGDTAGAAVWIRTGNGSAVRSAERIGDRFGGRCVTGAQHVVGAGPDAEVKGSDASLAEVPPAAYPWSCHPRSKDRRYRSSHRLVLHYMVPCMTSYGMCIMDDFLGSKAGEQVLHEVQELHRSGRMQDGKLANGDVDNTTRIRGDKITWVDGKEPGCESIGRLLSRMDKLITYADGKLGRHKIRGRHKVSSRVQSRAQWVPHVVCS